MHNCSIFTGMQHYPFLAVCILLLGAATNTWAQTKDTTPSLQISPVFPTYLRPGDAVELQASVFTKGSAEHTGQISLQLLDTGTNKPVDGWFNNIFPTQHFTTSVQNESGLRFPVTVPIQFTSGLRWILSLTSDSLQQQVSGKITIVQSPKPSPLPKGYSLQKQFFAIKNGKALAQPLTSFTPLSVADEVEVLLTIKTPVTLQAATIVDDAPTTLRMATHPTRAGKKLSFQPTATGMRIFMSTLSAGTHRIRYKTKATYMGTFHTGYLQLDAKNLKKPLLSIAENKLQVAE